MSFNVDFVAKREDARQIIGEEIMPNVVRDFLLQALTAWKPESIVRVKAVGHLYGNDYQPSTADISVNEILLRKPKPPTTS